MKFYNREKELERLSQIAALCRRSSHMVVITGRRRVGKTELIRHFSRKRKDILYLFVSRKKPRILLEEFRDVLAEKIPLIKNATFAEFSDFFSFLLGTMKENNVIVVFDEFQNFQFVDPSVFSVVQDLWDREKDNIKGAFIFIGSVFTLMRTIFEGKKEPLFGRATAKMFLEPLDPDGVKEILSDYNVDPVAGLPFYYTLFGGIPKYYFLLDRYLLFGKPEGEIIRKLFCEIDAPLQNEGKELLVEEFGKNYHLYFSILQVIAGGETQMARIADRAGINVNSISKYLDELAGYYNIIERRLPVTEFRQDKKMGRYYIKDPGMRFWFRYIFRNRSLIEIGDEKGLTGKIKKDLKTFMGKTFEELVRALLIKRSRDGLLPIEFSRIGGFWTRRGDVEIDIVAIDEESTAILFGECKLKGGKFSSSDARRLKEKAERVKWRAGRRRDYFALFSMEAIKERHRKSLEDAGILAFALEDLVHPEK